ncbi:MAG: SRPBCC domain-containing protein [Planctomycetales bacterium]|nr:SRPBCC domain-containing protein [Planctomycetales bacterium]
MRDSMPDSLPWMVKRSVLIAAPIELVFQYFTDSERWQRWWGAGSYIHPEIGSKYLICYPNGQSASGEVLELQSPERLVLSFGYEDAAKSIAIEGSRIIIQLTSIPEGTIVCLEHHVATESIRDQHISGWRYQLALFANLVPEDYFASAPQLIDDYYRAWSQAEVEARQQILASTCDANVTFADQYGCTLELEDLVGHVNACAVHFPGVELRATHAPARTQNFFLSPWAAYLGEQVVMQGNNLFEFSPSGKMRRIVGFPANKP